MKKSIFFLMVTSVYFSGFSENPAFVYNGRFNPAIKKEKLIDAVSISEIMPGLWRNLSLPFKERVLLNQLLDHQKTYYPLEYYFYPQENYQKIIDFISLEISATCAGHSLSAYSDGDLLTTEQRKILNTADLGTNVSIHIKFKYKNKAAENDGEGNHLREGIYVVTVVPETEAAFPGGFEAITSYLNRNLFEQFSETASLNKIYSAIIKFTVNEKGNIVDAQLSRSTLDSKLDIFILDVISRMPQWKPAENSKGTRVGQEIQIKFSNGC